MAGYCGWSKSINAVIAEQKAIYPATRAAKILGVSAEAIKAVLSPVEWHHTGPNFDRTDYYDTLIDEETRAVLKAYKPIIKTDGLYYADVKWLGWKGKRRHRKAIEYSCKNILVAENEQFYTFHTPTGNIRKEIGSIGTYVYKIASCC